jgi:uncharacterized membrane protein
LQIALWLLMLPFLLDALRRSGIERATLDELAVWVGLTSFIFAALLLSRTLPDGVTLSYSGSAFLALTLGYPRALLSMCLLLGITQPWSSLGQMLLVDALLPIWLMVSLVRLTRRYLPANPFVFLLGCGFLGLFFVYAVQQFASAALGALLPGTPLSAVMPSERIVWSLLLAGGEATLEGMIITVLVVYFPRAVRLFDDEFYLSRPM